VIGGGGPELTHEGGVSAETLTGAMKRWEDAEERQNTLRNP